jgi:hypothetical protein
MDYTAIPIEDYWLLLNNEQVEEWKSKDWFLWKAELHQFHSDSGYGIKTWTQYNKTDESSLIVNRGNTYGKVIACSKELNGLPVFDVPDEWENEDELPSNLEILISAYLSANGHYPNFLANKLVSDVIMPQVNKAKEKYRFTEEDMERCFTAGVNFARNLNNPSNTEYIESLKKPKQYSVELEMEEILATAGEYEEAGTVRIGYKPKIIKGKIKITSWKEI